MIRWARTAKISATQIGWGFSRWCQSVVLVSLSACALPGDRTTHPTLTDTRWQLIAIQSMDDAQGTTKIAEPIRFTLQLDADGRATMQLDCNRGSGSYEAKPAGDGSSGSLSFGPIAATRALCAPPHLDERIARDLPFVRSFLLKDGRLYLSLMADGGIYEWHAAQSGVSAY